MKREVDLIGYNGVIYTVDSSFSIAEAFAVKEGLFVEVGSTRSILDKYKSDNLLDFEGGAVYPGFNDAHAHLQELGQSLMFVPLNGLKSFEEVIECLKNFRKEHPDAKFLIGTGWDQNLWPGGAFPTNEKLSDAFPYIPVCLSRVDGHAVIVNDVAIKKLGITEDSPLLKRDECIIKNGKFTGVFMEGKCYEFRSAVAEYTREDSVNVMLHAQRECFRNGLTSLCDAGVEYGALKLIDSLVGSKDLIIRINAEPLASEENFEKITKPFRHDNLLVDTYKLYRDGALGSRGALLKEDYSDEKGNRGINFYPEETFREYCKWCASHRFRVAAHCIGDAANSSVLGIYAEILKGKNDKRWRIEHAQIVDDTDINKFGEYSIIPSVQPTHCTSDMLWAAGRIGERLKNGYRYHDLLSQVGWLPLGTDFPIESVNPIYTFFAAVFRKNLDFVPEGGFQMENALTREEALRGITIWPAMSTFEENVKGSIEVSKVADFVTTDKDLMVAPERDVPHIKVTGTWLGGKRVF